MADFFQILNLEDVKFLKEVWWNQFRNKLFKDNIMYMKNPSGYLHCYNFKDKKILSLWKHKPIGVICNIEDGIPYESVKHLITQSKGDANNG